MMMFTKMKLQCGLVSFRWKVWLLRKDKFRNLGFLLGY